MKKTIPFDLKRAQTDGSVKILTDDLKEVKILSWEGRDPVSPIIGSYIDYHGDEVISRWTRDGEGIHPGGVDLLLEEEEAPKGWYIKGEALCKDGQPVATLFIAHHNAMNKEDLLHRIAIALNGTENIISEVDYEEEENPVVTMSREDWVKIRERTELLEEQNKLLGEESHKKSLELERLEASRYASEKMSDVFKSRMEELEEEVRKWAHDCNAKQKTIDKLEAWKASVIENFKKWRQVKNFFNAMAKKENI